MKLIRACVAVVMATGCAAAKSETGGQRGGRADPQVEVRGTWMTTTANDAISSAAKTKESMRRLADIGMNTVYVEVWKNGYTQYPSEALRKVVGVDRRPALMKMDPSDSPEVVKSEGRDLLLETMTESHRNGLAYIAWFEYGFMAAHKSVPNDLWRKKPEWLSRDIKGNEIAPNGFVWMNPLHPGPRQFLLDLVLEAVDKYDLDGVQIDDRIVWPYINMGYDDYTKQVYASEHNGKGPPEDFKDAEWMRWRSEKVNEYSKRFVQEIRARRPGLIVSLSPAVYPWCYENYCLEWPKWSAWGEKDRLPLGDFVAASRVTPRWDEFIPQCYRFSYDSFEKTWLDHVKWMNELGGGRVGDMLPGIRVVGEGKDSTWEDLQKSIELTRSTGGGGHVLWYSKGAFLYEKELTALYDVKGKGPAKHPKLAAGWRPRGVELVLKGKSETGEQIWNTASPEPGLTAGRWRIAVRKDGQWTSRGVVDVGATASDAGTGLQISGEFDEMVWLRDRTVENTAQH